MAKTVKKQLFCMLTVSGTPLLLAFLLIAPDRVLSHGGHGNEFQGETTPATPGAIQVDAITAQRIGLKMQAVSQQPLAFSLRATGQIEAAPNRRVEVTNPVGGTVLRLYVQPGDTVNAGQPLALLSSPSLAELRVGALEKRAEAEADLQQARAEQQLAEENYRQQQQVAAAEIQQAQIAFNFAQERYDRDQELQQQGAIPRQQMLESQSQLAAARAALTKANSRLSVAEAAAQLKRAESQVTVAQSRIQLSDAIYRTRLRQLGATPNPDGTLTIFAPISGRVVDRETTLGQSAQDAGAKLMTIVDGQTVLASANIYEKDLSQVRAGQRVIVTVNGLPNRTFAGRITVIGSGVEGETRVIAVKAELINSGNVLKPGMFATLELLSEQTTAVTVIPRSALVEVQGQQQVYVQNGQRFEPVTVTLGRTVGDQVEVKQGVFPGDQLVVQGASLLFAQSLKGGRKPETDDHGRPGATSPNPSTSFVVNSAQIPLGIVLPVGLITAAGLFWSGNFWALRRVKQVNPGVSAKADDKLPPAVGLTDTIKEVPALPTPPGKSSGPVS